MTKTRRNWLLVLAALLLLSASLYGVFFISSPEGRPGAYTIDLAGMREMAKSDDLPSEIEGLAVGEGAFPAAAVRAGWSLLKKHPMVFASYRLKYDDRTVIIDTAHDRSLHEKMFPGNPFYDDRYEEMQKAMLDSVDQNGAIVLTHEHPDHIGGIARSASIKELARIAKITVEQLNGPSLPESGFPEEAKPLFTPYTYEGIASPAPGVVVAKASGHSPGSQLVYVILRDGREFLFVGDIAWDRANIETGIGRPLLVSLFFLHEDRQAVADQLLAIRELQKAEPGLNIIVAHDAAQFEDLKLRKVLADGFAQ
ncbi:MAG: MBL fold metallo-hydrolase [Leptonema illini]|jgi:glyoxylase-like metal-dependent hydrolase (beta-lactamase superfamily II)|uniref:MBL fold metallo-hydrolase n=1 Tax=Leptonema illini TaxID=183 RepID=A0A833M2S1_9LEPT|nr:MAG: MBL fold metallo-hydrolase [Leptonema illini]